ncbi:hypothetical protein [Paenibacillus sp. 22594]|uniref:hypothetical protein n=1 Tax=Paenibacillus sp. 22594 TaxID=3453947 RepID=UPI003F8390EC
MNSAQVSKMGGMKGINAFEFGSGEQKGEMRGKNTLGFGAGELVGGMGFLGSL